MQISMRTSLLCLAVLVGAMGQAIVCDVGFQDVMHDMHDGDQKLVDVIALPVRGYVITITPHGNNQTWVIKANWDALNCNASINFDVPGKPGPPPVPLTLTYFRGHGGVGQPTGKFAVFSDPSGTLAPSAVPLNTWVTL